MPRRRMLDPGIWKDPDFAKLTDPEKILFIGIISNADDEGRIIATAESLKADIFPYDHKKTALVVKRLRDSIITTLKNVCLYKNNEVEYISLLRWKRYQAPKHFKPSILPRPPIEPYEDGETQRETFSTTQIPPQSPPPSHPPSLPRSGQSSQGKVSIGQEDFGNYLNSEKDLTDFLTRTFEEFASRPPTHTMPILKKLWRQGTGWEMSNEVFDVVYSALRKYPIPVLAVTLAKVLRYAPGKRKPANYVKVVLDEQLKEYEKKNPAKGPAPPQ